MDPAILGVLAAGGVLVLTEDKPAPRPPGGARAIDSTISRLRGTYSGTARTGEAYPLTNALLTAPKTTTANGLSAEMEAEIKARIKEQWETMSGDAKVAACERLKSQFPDDSNIAALDCGKATIDQVLTVTAAAIGTALGGPVGGAIAVIAIELFGDDLKEWLNIGGVIPPETVGLICGQSDKYRDALGTGPIWKYLHETAEGKVYCQDLKVLGYW